MQTVLTQQGEHRGKEVGMVSHSSKVYRYFVWVCHLNIFCEEFLRSVFVCEGKTTTNKTMYSLVAILTNPWSLIIFGTIIISAVIERSISFSNRSSSSLIIKMPMKTCKRPMLCTFMLQEWWTLFNSKLLQISAKHNYYSERSNATIAVVG